jgi:hypothetical protein
MTIALPLAGRPLRETSARRREGVEQGGDISAPDQRLDDGEFDGCVSVPRVVAGYSATPSLSTHVSPAPVSPRGLYSAPIQPA